MFRKDTVKNALKSNVQIIFQWLKKLDERWKKEMKECFRAGKQDKICGWFQSWIVLQNLSTVRTRSNQTHQKTSAMTVLSKRNSW